MIYRRKKVYRFQVSSYSTTLFSIGMLLLTFGWNLSYAQSEAGPSNPVTGACYKESVFPDQYERYEITIPVYIGDDKSIIKKYTHKEKIVLKEASTKWVKKPADRNCISTETNDCLVWCLVEENAEIVRINRVLLDTNVTSEFENEYYTVSELYRTGGFTDWAVVVCESDITYELISRIRAELLMPYNYQIKIDSKMKDKLETYQKENGLPMGHLNKETLLHMGIDWVW